MIHVAEINDFRKLPAFRALWEDLWDRTPRPTFFQQLAWLEAYGQRVGREQRLRALIVSVAGRPIGIVPLVVKLVPSRLGTIRAVTYPVDSWGAFFGPLGPHPAATLAAAMRHLAQTRRDWDLIDLRYVDAEVTDCGRTRNAMRGAGLQTYCRRWYRTPIVEFGPDWEGYWGQLDESFRRRFERAERTVARATRLSLERWRPGGTLSGDTDRRWELLEPCLAAAQSQAGRLALSPQRTALLRDLHPAAVDAGWVDLSVLKAGPTVLGHAYGFHHGGVVELVHVNVAPGAPPETVLVLVGRLVRDSFERGDQQIIFGPLCSTAGTGWGNATRYSYRYTHFARAGACAQVLRLNHCVRRWLHLDPTVAEPVIRPRRTSGSPEGPSHRESPQTLRLPARTASP
ncbi:MAG: GNAT family N-acetyltransferase [Planctomycetes bacterium]|nr:GNAT family N-acetyltransferase [Planctomycetota bacterium]